MGRKSKWYQEFEGLMDRATRPALYGVDHPDLPEKFDPEYWRQWCGLPWEWDYRRDLERLDSAGIQDLLKEFAAFLGLPGFKVWFYLVLLAAEHKDDGRWVKLDYKRLAQSAGVSRRTALKQVRKLLYCNLVRLLDQGKGGMGNAYHVPAPSAGSLFSAKARWHCLPKAKRRELRSVQIQKERHT